MGQLKGEFEKLGISEKKGSKRQDGRAWDEMRPVTIVEDYIQNADGSCLISYGNTQVICTAKLSNEIPLFAKDKGIGWLTAEYSMLPGSTLIRKARDRNKVDGRNVEIQRLIGRSLRSGIDLNKMANFALTVDTDVINADGGTRTASITGGFVAAALAFKKYIQNGSLKSNPLKNYVVALSIGVVDGSIFLDLNYAEDEKAWCDMNVVATQKGELVDVSAGSGGFSFKKAQFDKMLDTALSKVEYLVGLQKKCINFEF